MRCNIEVDDLTSVMLQDYETVVVPDAQAESLMISLTANISRRDEVFGRDSGLSSYDIRHYFVSYLTTELPCFGGLE
jgi:hypothetical protein